ncbi:hypothetical protein [Rhodococcus sp. ACT016]|uniref:hypothetical protein n=1 Tax=Rhodococcus sp. ACT016 TaxID=3134808 RepID=UPI003D2A215D
MSDRAVLFADRSPVDSSPLAAATTKVDGVENAGVGVEYRRHQASDIKRTAPQRLRDPLTILRSGGER